MNAGPGEERIPILRLGDVLVASIQHELNDRLALTLQQDLTERAAEGARGVVIDVSSVEIVDSFLARVLSEIAAAAGMLAGETVVAGMRPSVAITLVEMGLDLRGLKTALSLSDALAVLGTVERRNGMDDR